MSTTAMANAAGLPPGMTAASLRQRIDSIDLLRGAVMVLMALDHVRGFFLDAAHPPLDLDRTSLALYATRWITHFCAPVFIFLAGVSAQRVSLRLTPEQLSRFLWTRGLWLVVLELSVVNFAWSFSPPWEDRYVLQVIWAIGCSMIALAVLVRLPLGIVAGIGIVLIAGHNAFDGVAPAAFGALAPLWHVLHVPGPVGPVQVAYPLIPWVGVMAAGFAFGALYDLDAALRRRWMVGLGTTLIALFLVLRLSNVYGDPEPWQPRDSALWSMLAVLNVHKYPPSLLFLCITLGPALLVLAAAERWRGRLAGALTTIGRVPLLFYVAHLYLAHAAAGLLALALGFGAAALTSFPVDKPWGLGLPAVYLIWVLVVVALFPLCRWFAAIKARRRDWWLSYL